MESTARRPFSGLFAFFAPRSTPVTPTDPQPLSQAEQLSLMIRQQKRINDLVYVCQRNEKGQLIGNWVKACSI